MIVSKNNIYINTILCYITVYFLYSLFDYSIVHILISIDSLLSSFDFLISYIKISYNPYNSYDTLINRYILYTLVIFIYYTINLLTYFYASYELTLLCLLVLCPYIQNSIIKFTLINKLIIYLYNQYIVFCKYVVSHLLSVIIEGVCKDNLNINPNIYPHDIYEELTDKPYSHYLNFIKIFLISTLILYMRNSSIYYGRLIKYLYNYGMLIKIHNTLKVPDLYPHIKDSKKKIQTIIQDKAWSQFYNADILRKLIEVYNQNKRSVFLDKLNKIFKEQYIYCSRFFATYALLQLFDVYTCLCISLSISLLSFIRNKLFNSEILLYKLKNIYSQSVIKFSLKDSINYNFLINITIRILCSLLYVNSSHVIFSFILEYSDLLNNIFVVWLIKKCYYKLATFIFIPIHFRILSGIFITYFSYPKYSLLFIFVNTVSPIDYFIYSTFSIFGFISNYDIIHLFIISGIIFLLIHIYYNIISSDVYLSHNSQIELQELTRDLHESYELQEFHGYNNLNKNLLRTRQSFLDKNDDYIQIKHDELHNTGPEFNVNSDIQNENLNFQDSYF